MNSPKAGELTGNTWIKLPKRLIIYKWEGLVIQKMDYKLISIPGLLNPFGFLEESTIGEI